MFPWFSFADSPPPKINTARVLLSKLRGGDYAHAGDREAIDLVIQKAIKLSPEIIQGNSLDVGSGFGGTANDLYAYGFHHIYGIDIDEAAVAYAQKNYPRVNFLTSDAKNVTAVFEPKFFSFIYLFNVMYAIEDKKGTLQSLNTVAKPGAILAVFDYSDKGKGFPLMDLAGKPIYPIVTTTFQSDLIDAGWEVLEIMDLSDAYITWYENLLNTLSKEKDVLARDFSKEDIDKVEMIFGTMLKWLQDGSLGGSLIFAEKRN